MDDRTKIAGQKTVADWKKLSGMIANDRKNPALWEEAYSDFLEARINSRYIVPMTAIEDLKKHEGKGFAIVAICCSLMEFFEALIQGYEFTEGYRGSNGDKVLSKKNFDKRNKVYYPLATKEIFIDFLTKNTPFNNQFTQAEAISFYEDVRCGILHQAQTNKHWLVKVGSSTDKTIFIRSGDEIHLSWASLKQTLIKFMSETYKEWLLSEQAVQDNFIFKWNSICQIT